MFTTSWSSSLYFLATFSMKNEEFLPSLFSEFPHQSAHHHPKSPSSIGFLNIFRMCVLAWVENWVPHNLGFWNPMEVFGPWIKGPKWAAEGPLKPMAFRGRFDVKWWGSWLENPRWINWCTCISYWYWGIKTRGNTCQFTGEDIFQVVEPTICYSHQSRVNIPTPPAGRHTFWEATRNPKRQVVGWVYLNRL